MKVSDYIVKLLEDNHITDVFGIPGVGCGHFMNSMIDSQITSHLVYNEQGGAFAACGYAQASNNVGMAYSTAGPGGTNLITGIANAYADSIPTIFMVGEKDIKELKGGLNVRQKASQEVDITEVCKPITKWSYQVKTKEEVRYVFERALYIAKHGRPGPVLIDMPSDIAREEVDVEKLSPFIPEGRKNVDNEITELISSLNKSKRPVFVAGNAVKQKQLEIEIERLCEKKNIPIISTLMAFDCFFDSNNYFGFLGMDGDPSANNALKECDLVVTLGARLNFKQIGYKRDQFAKQAQIIRVDVDAAELEYRLGNEKSICDDVVDIIPGLVNRMSEIEEKDISWIKKCIELKNASHRKGSLNPVGDEMMKKICEGFPEKMPIAVDTGSHRRWLMSQINFKKGQRFYQSSGLASMGYALPASIGIYYAMKSPVVCIDGDGGIMMNLQELQLIRREQLPITIFVFNNHALGDIMEFQKRIFDRKYFTTTEDSGYQAADYEGIANAFHFDYMRVESTDDVSKITYSNNRPQLIEVLVPSNQ